MHEFKTIADVISAQSKAASEQYQQSVAAATASAAVTTGAQPAAAEAKAATFKAVAVDDQGVIIGIGAMAGNIDRDGEVVQVGALLQMAYDFCASKARTFKANHDDAAELSADLVASMPGAPVLKSGRILKAGEDLPDDDPVVGINIEKGNEIAWFMGIRPHDPAVLEAARKGEIVGFSWGGFAAKE